jgi:hypothetical protein
MTTDIRPARDAGLPTDLEIALAPDAAYHRLRDASLPGAWPRTASRVVLIALAIGTAASIMAVQRVSIGLVLTTALTWGFVLIAQAAAGAAVIASARRRSVSLGASFDGWFAGHLPYSLWIMASCVLVANTRTEQLALFIVSAIVPTIWTWFVVSSFCRRMLDLDRAGARLRASVHATAMWGLAFVYVVWASGGAFQIVSAIRRVAGA